MPTEKLLYRNGAWVTYYGLVAAAPINNPPVASFTIAQGVDAESLRVGVDASASTDSDGTIVQYIVDFGNGQIVTKTVPSFQGFVYGGPGTYNIKLTVVDNNGLTGTLTKPVTVLAPPTNPGTGGGTGTQPTGNGISRIQDLTGATITAKLATTTNLVSFPPGTTEFQNFNGGSGENQGYGISSTKAAGLTGAGSGVTTLRMTPGSYGSHRTTMIAGRTTSLEYMFFGGATKEVSHMTVECISIGDLSKDSNGNPAVNGGGSATLVPQGSPYVYNGIYFNGVADSLLNDVAMTGGPPASDHIPPGETFGVDWLSCTNIRVIDTSVDGANIGGTAFGPNKCTNGTFTRASAKNLKYSCFLANYRAQGTWEYVDCASINNRTGFGIEQNYPGTVHNIRRFTLTPSSDSDVFIGASTATFASSGSAIVNFYDPILSPGQQIRVRCLATYGGATNLQKRSDIHVYVNGVDKTSTLIKFV